SRSIDRSLRDGRCRREKKGAFDARARARAAGLRVMAMDTRHGLEVVARGSVPNLFGARVGVRLYCDITGRDEAGGALCTHLARSASAARTELNGTVAGRVAGSRARLRNVCLVLSVGAHIDRRAVLTVECRRVTGVSFEHGNAVRIRLAGLVVARCLNELRVRVRAVVGRIRDADLAGAAVDRGRGEKETATVLDPRACDDRRVVPCGICARGAVTASIRSRTVGVLTRVRIA